MNKKMFNNIGIETSSIKYVNTVQQLIQDPPFMVAVKSKQTCRMDIDGGMVYISNGDVIIMPLNIYANTRRAKGSRKVLLKPYKNTFASMFKRYYGQNLTNKKLLVWRTGGIGDICFSQALIKYFKEHYENCQITYACAPRFMPIFKSWPKNLVDEVISIPFKKDYLINSDYHLSFEGAIERCKESEHLNCYDIYSKVAGVNIKYEKGDKYMPTFIPDENIISELKNIDIFSKDFVVIQAKASSPIRMMSTKKWVSIINKIIKETDINVAFLDSPNRHNIYDTVIKTENLDNNRVFNLCQYSKDIHYAIAIISLSKGVIGIDSSMSHIAPGLGKGNLGLYGSFRGDLRLKYYLNSDWVEPKSCDCGIMPCFFHTHQQFECPYVKNSIPVGCLDNLNEDEILLKFKNLFIK